jgi:hypothetical protein
VVEPTELERGLTLGEERGFPKYKDFRNLIQGDFGVKRNLEKFRDLELTELDLSEFWCIWT